MPMVASPFRSDLRAARSIRTRNAQFIMLHQLLIAALGLSVPLSPRTVSVRGDLALTIRPAVLSKYADAAGICDIRAPTQYVVEDGAVGFMGKKVELSPEEAHQRRVSARLGTAIRDDATVLIAVPTERDDTAAGTDDDDNNDVDAKEKEHTQVLATADLVGPLPAGRGRRALDPDLPARLLLRNLWVAESHRRLGIARLLMDAAEELTIASGVEMLYLEVLADNDPARSLYESLGFEDLEPPPPIPLPAFMKRGICLLGKRVGGGGDVE